MRKFAYIVSPLTIKQLQRYFPLTGFLPELLVKPFLKGRNAFKASDFKKIKSIQDNEITGFTVVCPILTRRLADDAELNLLIEAMQLAEKLGADIIGVSGYAAHLADKKYFSITKKIKTPVTSGNAFSAWSLFEQAYRVAKAKGVPLKEATIAILHAASTLGYLTARKLSDYASKITICDSDKEKLAKLKEVILHLSPIEVTIETDLHRATEAADIVINPADEKLDKKLLKKDALLIEGSFILVPGLKEAVRADLAEVILLALDEKLVSYSLGEAINIDKLEEIADIAVQHGFEVWAPGAPVL
jgi:predicted amino acid dehydrogenase